MAGSALKPVTIYSVAGRLRHKNAIYEKELVVLLKRRKVLQLVIFCGDDGNYSLAVLTDHRMEEITRPYQREGANVIRLRPVNIEREGFAALYSARHKTVRQYRSLDTLVQSLKRCGTVPPIYLRQGAPK